MTASPLCTLSLNCQLERPGNKVTAKIDLELPGITALFGPNGSGKTTLLRMVSGLEPATTGSIKLDQTVWLDERNTIAPHKRNIGMVFQDNRLFAHLSVAGNMAFASKRKSLLGPEIEISEVIEVFSLAPLLNKKPAALSGGERQRVAIARAILIRPKLLLMDEPLSALDIRRRAEILTYIETIPVRFGIPILYVTHSIDEVARLANNIALMDNGEIIASGPLEETLARLDIPPLTGRFEAGTILTGIIGDTDDEFALTTIQIANQSIKIPRLDLPQGQQIRLRIRARDVALATKEPTGISIRNVLRATITEIVAEPDTAFAEIRLEVEGQALRARLTRASVHDLKLVTGQPVLALIKSIAMDRRLLAAPTKRHMRQYR